MREHDLSGVRTALADGANPNALVIAPLAWRKVKKFPDNHSLPVLYYAIYKGWSDIVELLVALPKIALDTYPAVCEDEISVRPGVFYTAWKFPLEACINALEISPHLLSVSDQDIYKMVSALLAAGAWKQSENFNRAFCSLCMSSSLDKKIKDELATLFIKSGGDINGRRDPDGKLKDRTIPLFWAIDLYDFELFKALYNAGADITMEDIHHDERHGCTLLDIALDDEDTDAVDYGITEEEQKNIKKSIIQYLLYIGCQVSSRYESIVNGSQHLTFSERMLSGEFAYLDRRLVSAIYDVQGKLFEDHKARIVSYVELSALGLSRDVLTIVGQYIRVYKDEAEKEKKLSQQQERDAQEAQELVALQQEGTAYAEHAAQEQKAAQDSPANLLTDHE